MLISSPMAAAITMSRIRCTFFMRGKVKPWWPYPSEKFRRNFRPMTALSHFDPSGISNPKQNIYGLPFSEEDARLIILPVPWEVTVSYGAGTSRACEHVFRASMQVDLFDAETDDAWRNGLYMRQPDKKVLMKSDYLRKEAELYINFSSKDEILEKNSFMCKSLREINEGGGLLNKWVYEQTHALLEQHKLVGLLGGDHSTPLGYYKAIAEKH